ncbi:MAG: hypothetical protein E6895_09840, partial [Klebsiella sp.]|nr:hypothetical protein [Klebsiella sp.]
MAADLNPPLGTTTPEIFMDNVKRADELVNGPAGTVNDRAGEPLDTWRQMMAKNDEIRQNIIPLSKQYMTIEAAQADIVNIPEGSTTYVRSSDDAYLAIEYKNTGGVLQPTGRTMISGKTAVRRTDEYSDGVTYAWGKVMSSGEILPGTLQGMDGLPAPENVAAYAAKGVAVYQLNPADIP